MTPAARTSLRERSYAPGEDAGIAGIWRRSWAAGHPDIGVLEPIAHWHARVRAEFVPPNETWVVERDDQLLAFMSLHRRQSYVAQLYVDAHLRGQGLGWQLLDEACARMPAGWRLHVATANGAAQRFYERYGLVRGAIDRHPATGRERVAYHWRATPP